MLESKDVLDVVETVLTDLDRLTEFYNDQLKEDAESASMYMEDVARVNRAVIAFVIGYELDELEQALSEQDTFVRDHFFNSFEAIREAMEIEMSAELD